MIKYLTLFPFLLLFSPFSFCQSTHISSADWKILQEFWHYADSLQLTKQPVSERILPITRFFMERPYKSNTLNVTKKELPVINLRELDCVTFVENVLALAFLKGYNEKAIDRFIENIVKLRYRNGEIIDYTSRLHYSSDWLYEMQKHHLLSDITATIGGIKSSQKVYYMSQNYTRYTVLNQNKKLIPRIKTIENEINKRTHYYIPKDKIDQAYDKIKNGDIILITTNIKGLDTSHLGFAFEKEGKIYLLHASSLGKRVMLTELPLQEYMENIRNQSGIMVARINDRMFQPERN